MTLGDPMGADVTQSEIPSLFGDRMVTCMLFVGRGPLLRSPPEHLSLGDLQKA